MNAETKSKPTTTQTRKRLLLDAGFVAARLAAGIALFPVVVALFIANRTLGMIADVTRHAAGMAEAAFKQVGRIVERYKTATAPDDLLVEVADAEEMGPIYVKQIGNMREQIDGLESENASLHKQIDQLTDDLARAREGDL